MVTANRDDHARPRRTSRTGLELAYEGSGIQCQSHVQIAVRKRGLHRRRLQANHGEVSAGAKLKQLSPREKFELAVRAGIYTPDGRLTPPYRPDAEPSACRPTD